MSAPRNYARAALFALTSFVGWTFSDALLKLAREAQVPLGQIFLISGLSGMAIIFLISAARGKIARLQPRRWRGLVILGVLQWGTFTCWMNALPRLPLANMYVVSFLTPMTVAGLAALFLKDHLGWNRALAIATGFAGVVIAVNPAHLLHHSAAWVPYLSVFASMLGTSVQMLLLRTAGRQESNESMSFYPRSALAIAGGLSCAATGFVAMKPWVFLAVCGSGTLGGLGWALMAKAYKNAPATSVAPFQYVQMIAGALLGYFIWNNVPDAWLLGGASVIIASGIYLVRHERRMGRVMVHVGAFRAGATFCRRRAL